MLRRRRLCAGLAGIGAAAIAGLAAAHHGLIAFDTSTVRSWEGFVSKEMDGFPHWEINIRVDSVDWQVDLGNDFVLERAGFAPDGTDFAVGDAIVVEGYRAKDADLRRIAPVRITIDGKTRGIEVEID